MKSCLNLCIGLALTLVLFTWVGTVQADQAYVAQDKDIVIPLKYRGLDGTDNDISYGWSMGMGQQEKSTKFIEAVKKKTPQVMTIYNSYFKGAEWSVLGLKKNKPQTLYIDLDADGELDSNESIAPLKGQSENEYKFLTPDFYVSQGDTKRLCRTLMIANVYDPKGKPSCMWQPASVLEGAVTIKGNTQSLYLMTATLDNCFDQFGRARCVLVPSDKPAKGYLSGNTLSRLIDLDGTYYHLFVQGKAEDFSDTQAILRPYEGALGRLAVKVSGQKEIEDLTLNRIRIVGYDDAGIVFTPDEKQTELPVGKYKLSSGTLVYQDKEARWQASFSGSQAITILDQQTTTTEINPPKLEIRAVDEARRYYSDEKPRTSFTKGTQIYISRYLGAESGETYSQIYKITKEMYQAVNPHLKILNAKGKTLVSQDLEYG